MYNGINPRRYRRLKRAKEKAQQRVSAATAALTASGTTSSAMDVEGTNGSNEWGERGDTSATAITGDSRDGLDRLVAGDELESAVVLRADHRVRSFDFSPTMGRVGSGKDSTGVLVALHNNSMEVWGLEGAVGGVSGGSQALLPKDKKVAKGKGGGRDDQGTGVGTEATCSRVSILDMQGHRSDVRAVAVSSDGSMVASVSHGLAKVWSSKTRQCVRSTPCGFGLSVAFAPGDRHLLIGTKEGNLQVKV